jgi:DNA-binding protein HU-beta
MFTSSVIDALTQGNEISLIGFGKFSVSKIEARNGCNLKTGDSVRYVARQEILNLNLNAFMKT